MKSATLPAVLMGLRDRARRALEAARDAIPERYREDWYKAASAAVMMLLTLGVFNEQEAALWTQLGLGVITLLFALLHSTSSWRSALYVTTGPVGGVLMYYGLVGDHRWALITAAVGQALGITTAAAKTVQRQSP